jgi:hypothetical protein
MSCKTLLNQKLIKIFFLLIVLGFTYCSKEPKKKDYIARVNESYLTREDFSSLVDTINLTPFEKEQVVKNWVYKELLFQEAEKEGIVKSENYKNILKKSSKELAASILLNNIVNADQIEIAEKDMLGYYEKNKNSFQLNIESYYINQASFNDEDKAINFRSLAIESEWKKAAITFSSDTSLVRILNGELVEVNNLYPTELVRAVKDLYPQEISIVISGNPGYYSIVQMIENYDKGVTPPFEIIKDKVKKRLLAVKQKEIIDTYLKEIYSNNEIEIKK